MKAHKSTPILALTTAVLVMFGMAILSLAGNDHNHQHAAPKPQGSNTAPVQKTTAEKKLTHLYGNHACPVTGEPVDPESFFLYENKEKGIYARIYLCCQGCEKKVKKTAEETYMKFYRTDPKTGKSMEPRDLKNDRCPNTGEPIDPNAKIEYNGMIVHFCCPECAKEFLKDPEAKMAKLLPKADEFKYEAKAGSHSMKMKGK